MARPAARTLNAPSAIVAGICLFVSLGLVATSIVSMNETDCGSGCWGPLIGLYYAAIAFVGACGSAGLALALPGRRASRATYGLGFVLASIGAILGAIASWSILGGLGGPSNSPAFDVALAASVVTATLLAAVGAGRGMLVLTSKSQA